MPPISPLGPAEPSRPARRAASGGVSGFSVPTDPAAAAAPEASGASATAALGSMLALQEFGADQVGDRAARRHGHDLLSALAELQRALLAGDGGDGALARLADLVGRTPAATDQRLAAALAAITLRVRVELARRQEERR